MPALEITPAEAELPSHLVPPRVGAPLAVWGAYRDAARAAGCYRPAKASIPREIRRALPPPAPAPAYVPLRAVAPLTEKPRVTWQAPEPPTEPIEFYTPRPMPPKAIIAEVARDHDVTVKKLRPGSRLAHLVAARQEAMYRLRIERDLSLPEIGRLLGGFDHTTVLNGIRRYCARTGADMPPGMRPVQKSRKPREVEANATGGEA